MRFKNETQKKRFFRGTAIFTVLGVVFIFWDAFADGAWRKPPLVWVNLCLLTFAVRFWLQPIDETGSASAKNAARLKTVLGCLLILAFLWLCLWRMPDEWK